MAQKNNRTLNNFTAGELSDKVQGRIDLPVYQKGLRICENNIIIPQGGVQYRHGFKFVKYTRQNKKAVFIPFQFSDQQSYLIELTEFKMRFYKDNGIILEDAQTITGATEANPCVITIVGHGYETDDEVFLSGVGGMTELNGKYYQITKIDADTFSLRTELGAAVDSSAYTTFTSGGSCSKVYEVDSPWAEDHIAYVHYAQSADTMYLVNQNYEPRKLTREGHANWTLEKYSRTADPFTPTTKTISGATQANPCVITATAHGYENGQIILIEDVVGMTQLNNRPYIVRNKNPNDFEIQTLFGEDVDSQAYDAYTSGGDAVAADEYPKAVTFTDAGRLLFAATRSNPETMWGTKAPTNGTTNFEVHTTGTAATDAVVFTLAPIHGKVDAIQALTNTSKFIVALTYGAIRRIYGATEQEAIKPTGFTAKSVNAFGAAPIHPVSNGASLFYVQRGGARVRSLEYDLAVEGYTTIDRTLVSSHVSKSGIGQITENQGKVEIIWCVRNDGRLAGLTFKEREDISGWHRHYVGGSHVDANSITRSYGKVLNLGNMPRPSDPDQLWAIVERVIGGNTIRSVEYMADEPSYPSQVDYYTNTNNENLSSNEDADVATFKDVVYEKQKDAVHLDMSSSYDGSVYGTDASAAVTPAAGATTLNSTNVVFTASAAVFTADMLGREFWKAYDDEGNGGGRALITEVTDSTHIKCTIDSVFDNAAAIAAGNWYITTTSVTGIDYLNGETVGVCIDGGPTDDREVTNGAVTFTQPASKVHVGYKYRGLVQFLNIDPSSRTGSAKAKKRQVRKVALDFLNTVGTYFGTTPYNLERIVFRKTSDKTSRPPPLFTGTKIITFDNDSWSEEFKSLTFVQNVPLPCTILVADTFMVTSDDN